MLSRDIADSSSSTKSDELQAYKAKIVQQIYGILVLSFGIPPKPEDTFTWNYYEKDGKFHTITTTPLDFYRDNMGAVSIGASSILENVLSGDIMGTGDKGVGERFSLVNDPRNPYNRLLTVERLGNVVGGRSVRYVNVHMDVSFPTKKPPRIAIDKKHRP